MPSVIFWKGNAPTLTAQVSRSTFAGYNVDTTRTITIGTSSVSAVDSGGNLTAALTALAVLLNASTDYYFARITWTSDATHIIGTADNAGVGIYFQGSAVGTGTCSSAFNTLTANSGPCDLGTAANYSGGVLPATGDTLIFSDNSVNVAYTLDALSAVTLAVLRIEKTYTGLIGLPETQHATSTDGLTADTSFAEVRPQYMDTGWTLGEINENLSGKSQTGSGRLKLKNRVAGTTNIYDSASTGSDANLPPIQMLSLHASHVINVLGGTVGLCVGAGETSTAGTVNISGGNYVQGSGATITTHKTYGGNVQIDFTAMGSIYTYGGVTTRLGSVAVTTGTHILGGTFYNNSSASLAALEVNDGGTLSMSQNSFQLVAATLTPGHCGCTIILNAAGMDIGGSSVIVFSGPVRIVTTRA